VPDIQPGDYISKPAADVKNDLTQLGYLVSMTDMDTHKTLTGDLAGFITVSVMNNRDSSTATVFAHASTAEEKFDAQAKLAGLSSGEFEVKPSEKVEEVCRRMTSAYSSAAESLDSAVDGKPDLLKLLQAGIPALCSDQAGALQDVINGNIPLGEGTYEVGTGKNEIKPGTYQTTGSVDDCYWERTRADGGIVANNFVTHAKTITVTVKASDGSFTTERCGTWKRTK